jgi:hypothetical protein
MELRRREGIVQSKFMSKLLAAVVEDGLISQTDRRSTDDDACQSTGRPDLEDCSLLRRTLRIRV